MSYRVALVLFLKCKIRFEVEIVSFHIKKKNLDFSDAN